MTTEEIWKPVVGYEGSYSVSNKGGVRSLERVVKRSNGTPMPLPEITLRQHKNWKGYPTVSLWGNGKKVSRTVHQLVAEAFVPNPRGNPWVLHRNDDKDDNSSGNLYWGTPSENNRDRVLNGKDPNKIKTHCLRGHTYDDKNTYLEAKGSRRCRKCQTLNKTDKTFKHGTTTGYKYYKCRCDECRKACTEQTREYRRRVRDNNSGN